MFPLRWVPPLLEMLAADPELWRYRFLRDGITETSPLRLVPLMYGYFADQLPVDDEPGVFRYRSDFIDWLDGSVSLDDLAGRRRNEEARQADTPAGAPAPRIRRNSRIGSQDEGADLLAKMRAFNAAGGDSGES